MTLSMILLVAALVLLILAGFNVASSKVSLGWLGVACVVGAILAGQRF
jgi:hypothetical protein